MAAKQPVMLLPGHGLPIFGEDRVQAALLDTARYLETIHEHALRSLNRGLSIYEAIATLRIPDDLSRKPYLLAVYDEPEFILRNIYRLYGGWYSGVPSELKPATPEQLGREVARLAGGAAKLAARARELAGHGDLALACHLADWAADAEPKDKEIHAVRAEVYAKRTAAEASTMSKGIFGAATRESKAKS
jgi:alkyl sulfatase BDS1-like metallo-beta-lactamase superfamily hydrolase